MGFPGGASGKEPNCQCRRRKRHGFDPWAGRFPGEGMATHSNVLAWRILWAKEPGRLQSMGCKKSDTTDRLYYIYIYIYIVGLY